MAEYIHLVGAEEVARAGSTIYSAAQDMNRAASEISSTVYELRRILDEFKSILSDHIDQLKENKL